MRYIIYVYVQNGSFLLTSVFKRLISRARNLVRLYVRVLRQ